LYFVFPKKIIIHQNIIRILFVFSIIFAYNSVQCSGIIIRKYLHKLCTFRPNEKHREIYEQFYNFNFNFSKNYSRFWVITKRLCTLGRSWLISIIIFLKIKTPKEKIGVRIYSFRIYIFVVHIFKHGYLDNDWKL